MLFYLTSCIISSVLAFLYPGYASYKTLSQRPASEEDLERWLMYWSVLGCIVGIEYVAEWLVSWIPMYYLMKTLFLLYLVLPQTRGSSYIYINHLQPFLHSHESQIDATLASLKARFYAFVQERFRALWDQLAGTLRQQQQAQYAPSTGGATVGAPPSLGDPVSGPAQLVAGLWRSYGPTLVASGAMLLSQGTAASGSAIEKAWRTPAASQIHLDATQLHVTANVDPKSRNHNRYLLPLAPLRLLRAIRLTLSCGLGGLAGLKKWMNRATRRATRLMEGGTWGRARNAALRDRPAGLVGLKSSTTSLLLYAFLSSYSSIVGDDALCTLLMDPSRPCVV
ncbi:TB2/DP1, HVA22 family-domain-containing protein [Boletus reticuloceps]|uniref:Protein YOP1 n=1 Tax=Boletus reticuloceps TaxID=495285 RepID=A0A8I2YVB4_9AGAM|nr:TB2/DP1, HVA22 family-domain-containing protein [Boletus reticuloceps]